MVFVNSTAEEQRLLRLERTITDGYFVTRPDEFGKVRVEGVMWESAELAGYRYVLAWECQAYRMPF